jgi:hypothetical protein
MPQTLSDAAPSYHALRNPIALSTVTANDVPVNTTGFQIKANSLKFYATTCPPTDPYPDRVTWHYVSDSNNVYAAITITKRPLQLGAISYNPTTIHSTAGGTMTIPAGNMGLLPPVGSTR